jgi:NADH-quinone oxidoreductase subunit L
MPLETVQALTWLIPLPPLLAFFLIVLVTNRSKGLSHTVALVSILTAWVLSWTVLFNQISLADFGKKVVESAVPWLPFGSEATGTEPFTMGVLVDPLTAVMLFFVPLACAMIFLYSVGYQNWGKPRDLHDKPGEPPHNGIEPLYSRFFAYLSLFAFGMLLLCVADNLLLLFVGWEIMGLCSYLLIGFWYARKYENPKQITPRQAAVKAFMTTRVADVIMMLGIVYLYSQTGTLNFREIMFAHEGEMLHTLAGTPAVLALPGFAASHLIGLLLLAGTVGKSAQFPLHTWLPDAMEGPTPVSAMIHAAAMVSAGVYAMIRVYPIFAATPGGAHGVEAMVRAAEEAAGLTPPALVMAAIGAFTALFAATIAVAQNDVKKVLAYSTISQLGFMLAALGIGGYIAATFHLMTHAFFKALLFLGSGSIIHGVEHGMHHSHEHIDPQDMRYMGGLRSRMPVTFWTFLIGGFALAGFPFITAGFWSKDEILLDAWTHAPVVFYMLAAAALLTAFYTMRQITMVFFGKPRTEAAAHAHESHWTMTLPLGILSFFAVTAGWLNIPEDFPVLGPLARGLGADFFFKNIVGGALVEKPEAIAFTPVPLLTSIGVALVGLGVGWWMYRNAYQTSDETDPLAKLLPGPIYSALKNKYWFDELYDWAFVRPTFWLARAVSRFDRSFIDTLLHLIGYLSLNIGIAVKNYFDVPVVNRTLSDGSGEVVKGFGQQVRILQTGRVQQYLLMTMAVILAVGVFLLLTR